MKPEKERAEAYVREKLPELMELGLGCFLKDDTNIFTYLAPSDFDGNEAHLIMHGDGHVTEHIHGFDLLEVVGHPIQLQHWLRVLPWDKRNWYFTLSGCLCDRGQENKALMAFDMTTGQPATEADYKVFNEIVGA